MAFGPCCACVSPWLGAKDACRIKLDLAISSATFSNIIMLVIMLNVVLLPGFKPLFSGLEWPKMRTRARV